jgi:hypothetical protein
MPPFEPSIRVIDTTSNEVVATYDWLESFSAGVPTEKEKGTSVTHAHSDHPRRLFRLGSKQEPWVLGSEEMRSLSETGELGDRRIPLNKPVKWGESGETG